MKIKVKDELSLFEPTIRVQAATNEVPRHTQHQVSLSLNESSSLENREK
jgi:hypothetical protein